jgi:hypothetical protein
MFASLVLALAVAILALPAQAQGNAAAQSEPPPLPQLEAIPEQPSSEPPDPDLEPSVTIVGKDHEVVEEVRVGGQLRFLRVTPAHGRPYYLIPDTAPNTFIRRDSLDSGVRAPMWVLWSW